MVNNYSLDRLIDIFVESNEKNLQLDIFRDNGEVIIQIFKQYDVNGWGINFESNNFQDAVLELSFHKDKTNNTENFKRFFESSVFNDFKEVDKNDYFTRIKPQIDKKNLYKKVMDIIDVVYKLENESIHYTLNAY